jgi:single-strand DNA-binding protein
MQTRIILVGNTTDAAEVKVAPSGDLVTSFTLAVSDRVKDSSGEWKDSPATYYNISVWPSAGAEGAAEAVKKGARVMVDGTLKVRPYTTKEGVDRQSLDVTASEVALSTRWMGSKKNAQPARAAASPSGEAQPF